jgi:hypothetical protein
MTVKQLKDFLATLPPEADEHLVRIEVFDTDDDASRYDNAIAYYDVITRKITTWSLRDGKDYLEVDETALVLRPVDDWP